MIATYILVAAAAYLLGSIPFGYLLVRLFRGYDIRESGSGNIGATNVARSAPVLGLLTLLLDAGKGFLCVALTLWLFLWALIHDASWTYQLGALAALFAVLGHMFPVWLKFKGGKGVATAVGAFGLLAPRAMLIAVIIFLIVMGVTRYVSLGSVMGSISFPIAVYFLPPTMFHQGQGSAESLAVAGLVAALIVVRHQENLRRLFAGSEPRFQWRRT